MIQPGYCLNGCGTSLAGRGAHAKTCSPRCRKALQRRRQLVGPDMVAAATDQAAADPGDGGGAAAPPLGKIEQAVTAKLEPLGRGDDPLAVYLVGLARTLDNPSTIAGGSLSSVGREFRETYATFFKEHGTPEGDGVDAAKDAVAAKRAEMMARRQAGVPA